MYLSVVLQVFDLGEEHDGEVDAHVHLDVLAVLGRAALGRILDQEPRLPRSERPAGQSPS